MGKFMFRRLPFGWKTAPAIFQRIVSVVLMPVSDSAGNYIDDVIVYSRDWASHFCDVRHVSECLGSVGFNLKLNKCVFGRKYLEYFGRQVGCGKVAVPEARVKVISEFCSLSQRSNCTPSWRACLTTASLLKALQRCLQF